MLLVAYPEGTVATTSNASMLNHSTAIIVFFRFSLKQISRNCSYVLKQRSIILHSSTVRRSLTGIILYQTTANIVFFYYFMKIRINTQRYKYCATTTGSIC
jgi:hypothetical protein